jgi:hypothetical protein
MFLQVFNFFSCTSIVTTLTLGLWPRQRLARAQAKRRMWEWKLTLSSELPIWELESPWTPKLSKSDCKSQNISHWGVFYIVGKLLKCKCLKWDRMTRLDICNTSYGKKKGRESNWQFDSQPWKVLPCVQVTCDTPLESSSQELQLCFRPRLDQRSKHRAMASQSCENPTLAVSRPLWESRKKKAIWMWASRRVAKSTIWGKVVASPESRLWWVLWVRGCPWLVRAPSVVKTLY